MWQHSHSPICEGVRTADLIAEIEQLGAQARPVPLTDQVRLNPARLRELISELREALAEERRS